MKNYIWFDLGYTLLYQKREPFYQEYLLHKGIEVPLEEIERAYHLADKLFMREYPGVLGKNQATFYPWYLGVVNYYLGQQHELKEQNEFIRKRIDETDIYWEPFSYVHDTLSKLQADGYQLGLISNWDQSARELLEHFKLSSYFQTIVVSSEIGYEKPSREIFEKAFKLAGASVQESLYVGDNYYDDVVGSHKVQLDAALINRFGQLGIEELSHPWTIQSVKELPKVLRDLKKINYQNGGKNYDYKIV